MSWISNVLGSSIGKKLLMALSGLFICFFLVIHLTGNLQLLAGDGGQAFNEYAKLMTSNPLIKFVSIGTYLVFLLHIIDGLMLVFANKKARPVKYAVGAKAGSSISSRNMGILGSIILVFLVIHLYNFWFVYKFGSMPTVDYGHGPVKDLYKVVAMAFANPAYVILYVLSMVAIAFHLIHGFASAFQTLGLNHAKYNGLIKIAGIAYSILIPLGFAIIPIYFYLVLA